MSNTIADIIEKYSEETRTDPLFYMIDPPQQKGEKKEYAYTTTEEEKADAKVSNPSSIPVTFVPLDQTLDIYKESKGTDQESLCDGLLYTDSSLYLVELKSERESWRKEAKEQLENTIELLKKSGVLSTGGKFASIKFKHRYAYACNRQRRTIRNQHEKQKRFYKENGFHLLIKWEIKI